MLALIKWDQRPRPPGPVLSTSAAAAAAQTSGAASLAANALAFRLAKINDAPPSSFPSFINLSSVIDHRVCETVEQVVNR